MLNLVKFIMQHTDWEEMIVKKPYCITVKRDNGLMLFSYSQIDSDFFNPIVRECRGIILEESTLKPVCVPFYKFGNYGESYAPVIDWASSRTEEKIDGSLIKLYYYNDRWCVATNGTIDAFKAEICGNDIRKMICPYKTFGELFNAAAQQNNLDYDKLDKGCTYMFELISPYNKVVVPYSSIDIYHIGTRENVTLQESQSDIGIKKPRKYDLHTLEDCAMAAFKLPYSEEGYVVIDKFWNRVKIKSPAYVAVHHIKSNGDINIPRVIELIILNETAEFLGYFPEYAQVVTEVSESLQGIIEELESNLTEIKAMTFGTQKDFALYVKDRPYSGFYFQWRKDNTLMPKKWLYSLSLSTLKDYVKKVW